ncbi:MAG TPA: UDP-N-acetylmuramoyl-L-alanine--D-glutamate ligase [Gemmatimonadaceae bacterium]|nr:UDP-N-acetylmuramoyl-L-alanine--D-glutamate ligase [Gemmatimonadaceae bacterium]
MDDGSSTRNSAPALSTEWVGREIAVVGLARSGRAVALVLARAGSEVYASDSGHSQALDRVAAELRGEGVHVDIGRHDLDRIARASLVVASPGVPPNAPPLAAARAAGAAVVSEVEIALRFLPELRYIGITGTNGKTTTTALASHLLNAMGRRAAAAGNIGQPLSDVALSRTPPEWVALELSSYQLHDTPGVDPRVGVITNLSPNHLDRYTDVAAYYGDKALLLRNAAAKSQWVTNGDDPAVQSMVRGVPGLHCRFSLRGSADAWLDRESGYLVALGQRLVHRDELQLVGDHNVGNALAAALAVLIADPAHREADAITALAAGLRTFRPLEHRIEPVADGGGVRWINDSKSTNVASSLVALAGMRRPTVVLLGGRHKGEAYTPLADELRRTARAVIAFGEAGPLIEHDLGGVVPVVRLGSSFEDVIDRARQLARPGDVILLSPACSSFDMFTDYEHRGREFTRLARAKTT